MSANPQDVKQLIAATPAAVEAAEGELPHHPSVRPRARLQAVGGMLHAPVATRAAKVALHKLQRKFGALIIHLESDRNGGAAPFCYLQGDFPPSSNQLLLGKIEDTPCYIPRAQLAYWRSNRLILDAAQGKRGFFALENHLGIYFITRTRLAEDCAQSPYQP